MLCNIYAFFKYVCTHKRSNIQFLIYTDTYNSLGQPYATYNFHQSFSYGPYALHNTSNNHHIAIGIPSFLTISDKLIK